jgi:hypothetical protein
VNQESEQQATRPEDRPLQGGFVSTTRSHTLIRGLAAAVGVFGLLSGGSTLAQVTPASGYTPPDDTPSIKVGTTIFTGYTYQDEPTALDADGNTVNPSSWDLNRAYINVTGNISHRVSFRVTPDVTRLSTTVTGGAPGEKVSTSADGSLIFRLKYAYGQFNLDEAWSKGSWVRLGQHHTPYVDWEEQIYRYRFQGQIFMEREGFLSSADVGLSTHYNFPGNYGDVHVGYYNGDTYSKAEPNDQKAIQIRASLRPAPEVAVLKGLRLTAFYDADNYIKSDPRNRLIYAATFEHKYVNAGFEHLNSTDQPTGASGLIRAEGYSIWATPKSPKGWEGLLRYDHLKPNTDNPDIRARKIVGVAYWFKSQQAPATAALLLDYENVTRDSGLVNATNPAEEKRYALHALFNY